MKNREQQILSEIRQMISSIHSQLEILEEKLELLETGTAETVVEEAPVGAFEATVVEAETTEEVPAEVFEEAPIEIDIEDVLDVDVVEEIAATATSSSAAASASAAEEEEETEAEVAEEESTLEEDIEEVVPQQIVEEESEQTVEVVPEQIEEEVEMLIDVAAASIKPAVIDTMTTREAWRTDMPGSPVKDIRSAISLNDRILFINGLFDEDPMLFQSVLTKINSMAGLDEVVEYLRAERPSWDMESDEVYRFMMAVRRRIQ